MSVLPMSIALFSSDCGNCSSHKNEMQRKSCIHYLQKPYGEEIVSKERRLYIFS